jgi:RNA polymerase II subunit A-like phosphatase
MTKTIRLGARLRYPITIVKLIKVPGDEVKKQEPLMRYSFKWTETVGDHIRGDTWEEERVTVADWDSPVDGEIRRWQIREGEVINADCPCLVVQESCSHGVQFQGLCAFCGKDMTEVNWATDSRDTERAPINMTHDATSLTVSATQAQRAEQDLQKRLLQQRKLSLVVDLDQTIIHACIEPTIGEWQRDPNNPNYESVKEVRSFQLNDDGPRGLATGCWYYIKLRPGLEEFLRKIADKYELHVYTMGTRAYALNIAKLVDPQQKLFGNRVISRDENGSMTAKSLQRLFPVSTNMVVIIDDRADVWPRNRPNLIKVVPYDFFKGIGDINSSFLPKREDLLAPQPEAASPVPTNNDQPKPKEDAPATSDAKDGKPNALEELVTMSGADNPAVTKRQIEQQARELEKQIKDRPLLHLQEQLDKEDEQAEKTTPEAERSDDQPPASPPHQRHHLLLDDDRELHYLEQHLMGLHEEYYREYDRVVGTNPDAVPDVGRVLDALKGRVLKGTKLVLSGLVPIGMDVKKSELGLQVASFGAELRDGVSRDITHLVVSSSRPRTQKVRQAAQFSSIKIVNQEWLLDSLTQWRRMDETPYLVAIHPADRARPKDAASAPASLETTDAEPVSDADDSEDGATTRPKAPLPRLQLSDNSRPARDLEDNEPDSEDEKAAIDEHEDGLVPPEMEDGQMSPVDALKTFDWGEADAELDEFLASDSEDGDDGDDGNDGDGASTDRDTANGDVSRKRKHDDDTDDGDSVASEADSVEGGLSNASKKQRLAHERPPGSSLRAEYHVDEDTSLPTPNPTGDEGVAPIQNGAIRSAEETVDPSGADDDDSLDIDEDELEADLLAEFEAEEREEEEEERQRADDLQQEES